MPRDGSGNFTLAAGNPVVPDTLIETGWANPTLEDIGQQITNSVAADGQTTPVANLPMGGYRHTGVSDPTSRNQYNTLGMSQDGRDRRVTILSGTNNLVGSLVGGSTTYTLGQFIAFVPLVNNTGPVTLSINGGAPVTVLSRFNNQLQANDLQANALYLAAYTGAAFQLQSSVGAVNELFIVDTSPTGNQRPESGVYSPLTIASGTSISVPPGVGFIVPPGPEGVDSYNLVQWQAQTVNLVNMTGAFTSTITVDNTGVAKQHLGRVPSALLRTEIVLGMVLHLEGTITAVHTATPVFGDNPYYGIDLGDMLTNNLAGGAIVSANGTNPLQMDIIAGRALLRGASPSSAEEPNYLLIPAATGFQFRPLAGAATFAPATALAPVGNYDPGGAGTITAIPGPATTAVVHRLYYLYGTFVWVYGQYTYTDFGTALARLEQDRARYIISPRLTDGILIAEIVATKGTTSLADATSAAILSRGTVFYGLGSAGSISDAPADGTTYGRKNAAWTPVIGAATPSVTGNLIITKSDPLVQLVDSPTGTVAQGIEAFRGANKWWVMESVQGDDTLYIRSYNPADGVIRSTTEYDLATGRWSFPEEVVAPAASLTDGTTGRLMPVGSFGLGAEGQATATANLDSLSRSGYYWADGATLNSPGAGTWAVQHMLAGTSSTDAVQMAVALADGSVQTRTKVGGIWGVWAAVGGTGGGGANMKVQIFTASGTWTKPDGVTAIEVILVGGGQGGAGGKASANTDVAGGGGGGGGQVIQRSLPVTGDVTVTIGAGGAGGIGSTVAGTVGTAPGSNGGDSSLAGGAILVARGGGSNGNGPGTSIVTTGGAAGGGGGSGGMTEAIIGGGTNISDLLNTAPASALIPGRFSSTSNKVVGYGIRGLLGYGGGGAGGCLNTTATLSLRGFDGGGIGGAYQVGIGNPGGNATANTGGGGGGASCSVAASLPTNANGGTGAAGICIIKWWE